MTDESDKGFGPWSRVPQWDGSPQTWRKFKRDVSWWISSLELASTSKYNLAARFLLRQEGIARQRGEEFQPDDLKHRPAESVTDPETGEELEASPADYLAGINKLMAAWETMNGRTALDKRGELRQAFYVDLSRKAGERVSEFCTRYRSLVADLRAEGVVIADGELGWFLRQKLGLDPLRKQLLDTSLQGSESYATIESEILRLFRDLHENDPLHRRFENRQPLTIRRMFASQRGHPSGASSAASTSSKLSSMSSWSKGPSSRAGSQPKQAYVTEALDEDAEEEALDDGSADPGDSGPLEEALQAEAEVLACELEEAEQEGVDPEIIQDLEAGIESAAETLVTMREARQTLANVRKDRGYGKATSGGGGKGNGKKNAQIQARKQSGKHNCFDCGQPGHWSGDKECPTPGAGAGRRPGSTGKPAKQVRITENEHVAAVTETVGLPLQDLGLPSQDGGIDHDVLMVAYMPKGMTLEQALQQNVGRSTLVADSSKLAPDKELVGALDSACNRSCCGNVWLNQYLEALKSAPKHVQDLIKCENECENFRFGNNGVVPSVQRWRLPAMIGQTLICIWISMVPIGTLGCLIGRDFMEAVGAIIDFTKRTLTCSLFPSGILKLGQMMAGHFMLEMVPVNGEWGAQTRSKWRRVGQDGIVDIQMERKSWAHYKMHMFVKHRPEHEHQLTEQALEASLFTGQLSSSSSSHESVLCELAGASSGSMAQSVLGGGDFEHCHADQRKRPARCQHPRKMAPNGPSHSTTCRLAQPRHSVVGGSASRMALLALSLSFGQVLFGLGSSVASHGNWPDLASWTPGEGGWQDDSFSSWGMSQASRPRGIPPSLLGGYAHGSYDWPWQWISWEVDCQLSRPTCWNWPPCWTSLWKTRWRCRIWEIVSCLWLASGWQACLPTRDQLLAVQQPPVRRHPVLRSPHSLIPSQRQLHEWCKNPGLYRFLQSPHPWVHHQRQQQPLTLDKRWSKWQAKEWPCGMPKWSTRRTWPTRMWWTRWWSPSSGPWIFWAERIESRSAEIRCEAWVCLGQEAKARSVANDLSSMGSTLSRSRGSVQEPTRSFVCDDGAMASRTSRWHEWDFCDSVWSEQWPLCDWGIHWHWANCQGSETPWFESIQKLHLGHWLGFSWCIRPSTCFALD